MAILIEKQTVNEYSVRIIKNKIPVFGGFYRVELVFKNTVINFKDGLNLDASKEVLKNTVEAILSNAFNKKFN